MVLTAGSRPIDCGYLCDNSSSLLKALFIIKEIPELRSGPRNLFLLAGILVPQSLSWSSVKVLFLIMYRKFFLTVEEEVDIFLILFLPIVVGVLSIISGLDMLLA